MGTATAPTRHSQRTPMSLMLYLLTVLALIAGPLALISAPPANASDASLADCKVYDFTYSDGHTDAGTYCDNGMDVTQDNTPGLHVIKLHVSCSDEFTDGTSDGSSDLDGHTVEDWSIVRHDKDGAVKKTCGSTPDEDPDEPEVTCPEQDMTAAELATALWQAGSDVHGDHDAQGTQATVVLPEGFCEAEVNFTSYTVPDDTLEPFDDQVLFENKTVTVTPETTPLTVDIGVPSCNWHTALYTGPVIDVPPHGTVLIDWGKDLSLGGCADGDDPDGDDPDGDDPDGDDPDGDDPDGDDPDGDDPDGDDPDGDDPDGDDPDGDDPDGDDPDGDDPDGDDPDGDDPDGDDPDGDDPEGDDPEGDDPEGDDPEDEVDDTDETDEVADTTDEVCVGDMTIRVVVAGFETLVPGSVVTVDGQQLTLASGQQSLTDLDCGTLDTTIDDVPPGFAIEPPTSQQATISDGGVATVTYEVSRVLGAVLTADDQPAPATDDDPDQAPASLPATGSPAMLLLGIAAAAAVLGGLLLGGTASTRRREYDTA